MRLKGIFITLEPQKGASIRAVCDSAKELSEFLKEEVKFEFNGVPLTTHNMSINDMVEKYCTHFRS